VKFVFVVVEGGGENKLDSSTGFEEELTTDLNGSKASSGPDPKSEAASWTVLILSYARGFPRDSAGPRGKTKRRC
jgi:hypothetical protein